MSIALAFALRPWVRAKLRGREMLPLWLGGGRVQFVRVVRPAVHPAFGRSRQSCAKPLYCSSFVCTVSRCFLLLPVASRGFP